MPRAARASSSALTAGGSIIQGNVIGLNVDNDAVGNGYSGITLTSTSTVNVGGAGTGKNVLSGNGLYGLSIIKVAGGDPVPDGHVIKAT